MATYVIGDIHGYFEVLQRLLERFRFSPAADRIWLVGDLVNRGPQSLEVLQWAKSLEGVLTAVLGNHDLYLLGRALCGVSAKKSDTLSEILRHPDGEGLIDWLRQRPFVHQEDGRLLVHAGVLPSWNLDDITRLAQEATGTLIGAQGTNLLRQVLGQVGQGEPGLEKLSDTVRVFTRLRICGRQGSPRFEFVGPLGEVPSDCTPWFITPGRQSDQVQVFFGHWSTLGYYRDSGVCCLDSGCAHGGALTAIRLEDGQVFQEQRQPASKK